MCVTDLYNRKRVMDHPLQPIVIDEHGHARFKANAIVRHLLDAGGIDMNKLAVLPFDENDREQFAQLIGYSLGGFSELSYVRDVTYEIAMKMSKAEKTEQQAKLEVLEAKLEKARSCLRELVPELFHIHPDDLVV